MFEELDPRLTALFSEYRAALPDPEGSPGFMPGLWARIEARQATAFGFRRLAQAIATAAAAVSLIMGAWLVYPRQQSPFYTNTYLELLAAGEQPSPDNLEEAEIVSPPGTR